MNVSAMGSTDGRVASYSGGDGGVRRGGVRDAPSDEPMGCAEKAGSCWGRGLYSRCGGTPVAPGSGADERSRRDVSGSGCSPELPTIDTMRPAISLWTGRGRRRTDTAAATPIRVIEYITVT